MVTRVRINGQDCSDAEYCDCDGTSEFTETVACTEPPRPVYVHLYNLGDESVEVYRVHETCCDGTETPWDCNRLNYKLTKCNPGIILTMPGRYKFRTASGELFEPDVKRESSPIPMAFAQLRIQEQALCCCQQRDK